MLFMLFPKRLAAGVEEDDGASSAPSLLNRPGRGVGRIHRLGSDRIGSKAHLRELRKGSDKSEPSWMIDGPIWCLLSSHGLNCISLEQAPRAIYARQGQTIENIYTRLRDKCQFVHRNAETKDLLDTEGLDDMRLK